MGQYHVLVNVDKKEVVVPHALGMGLKMWEHCFGQGTLPQILYVLLATSPDRGGGDLKVDTSLEGRIWGRWCGDRVLVVGDYTEDDDVPSIPNASKLYDEADSYHDISKFLVPTLETTFGVRVTENGRGWNDREVVTDFMKL